ncbi:hypothetical protein HDU96_007119 [Phlyctochytrium bullatum]|nr:hypothetical protein HDU96_007119 [Phlyctochytrium bullatum]
MAEQDVRGSTSVNPLSKEEAKVLKLHPWPELIDEQVSKFKDEIPEFEECLKSKADELGIPGFYVAYGKGKRPRGRIGVKTKNRDLVRQLFVQIVIKKQDPSLEASVVEEPGSSPRTPLPSKEAERRNLFPWFQHFSQELEGLDEPKKKELENDLFQEFFRYSGKGKPMYFETKDGTIVFGLTRRVLAISQDFIRGWKEYSAHAAPVRPPTEVPDFSKLPQTTASVMVALNKPSVQDKGKEKVGGKRPAEAPSEVPTKKKEMWWTSAAHAQRGGRPHAVEVAVPVVVEAMHAGDACADVPQKVRAEVLEVLNAVSSHPLLSRSRLRACAKPSKEESPVTIEVAAPLVVEAVDTSDVCIDVPQAVRAEAFEEPAAPKKIPVES